MKNTFPTYCKKFVCLADKCPDTCCAGWSVVVDDESCERYFRERGSIGKKLCDSILTDDEGDRVFRCVGGRCSFLLENGLCEIYSELGRDALCVTCTRFPRFITDMGSRIESGISLSCPEAARLIIGGEEPVSFVTEETDGRINPSDFDPELYFFLVELRDRCIGIMQNRSEKTDIRLAKVLSVCEKADIFARHGTGRADVFAEPVIEAVFRPAAAKKAFKKYISDHLEAEALTGDWKNILTAAQLWEASYPDENELENLAVYFLFRYLMTAAFDGRIFEKAAFCAAAYIIIKALCLPAAEKSGRIRLMQRYSKEIEHSAVNMELLAGKIRSSRYYRAENLINILLKGETI